MASGVAPWVQNAVGGGAIGHTLTLEKVADERVLVRTFGKTQADVGAVVGFGGISCPCGNA